MNKYWLKIALKFLLKYIIGFAFAVICFVAATIVGAVYTTFTTPGSCIGALGNVFAVGILTGIPTGAVLGIYLFDKFILGVAVLKQQIIAGFVAGIATSASLIFLLRCCVEILFPPQNDTPIVGILIGFFVIGVLAVLLGYTIAGLTKRKKTPKTSSQ